MTTHEPHTEATPTLEEVDPATPTTEHQTGQADSSTAGTGPAPASTGHTASPFPGGERSAAGTDAAQPAEFESSLSSQPRTADEDRSTARSESATAGSESPAGMAETSRPETETSPDRSLFADDQLAGLRARWDSVQAGFVDDPEGCVQKADGLVSDVVEQLTTGFTEARSRLEQQWGRGEEASTEDLRVAFKRYREFFERLLAM
jgi:hypothetical protein